MIRYGHLVYREGIPLENLVLPLAKCRFVRGSECFAEFRRLRERMTKYAVALGYLEHWDTGKQT